MSDALSSSAVFLDGANCKQESSGKSNCKDATTTAKSIGLWQDPVELVSVWDKAQEAGLSTVTKRAKGTKASRVRSVAVDTNASNEEASNSALPTITEPEKTSSTESDEDASCVADEYLAAKNHLLILHHANHALNKNNNRRASVKSLAWGPTGRQRAHKHILNVVGFFYSSTIGLLTLL